MHHELVLMLLADARLPVGGHTQSGTVEAALAHGLTAHDVPSYLRTRLRSVMLVEAGSAVVARHRASCGGDVADVDVAWAARTPSSALRQASRGQGRALRRLVGLLRPEALEPLRDLDAPSRATVLGVVAGHVGLPAGSLARLVGYDDVQTVCAAVLKLVPLDPALATGWVAAALPEIAALAEEVADLTAPNEIPAVGCPQIEVWAEAHAITSRRLFRA